MKCFYCNRQILDGTRIVYNGIKYICKNVDDLIKCNDVKKRNDVTKNEGYNTKLSNYIQSPLVAEQNGRTKIKCSCGNSFYTCFPIETYPPCDDCPHCGITHRQPH